MSQRAHLPHTRADFRDAVGVLLVQREPPLPPAQVVGQPAFVAANPAEGPETLIAVWDDGSVTALAGHVDLGTGLRTALTQIVAEELDVDVQQVCMLMGSTSAAPNQGATIASASIQIHAVPLRHAAAQARAWLVERAAEALHVEAGEIAVDSGVVRVRADPARDIGYGDLLTDRHVELTLAHHAPLKSPADYRVVGTSTPRVDIPAKATGAEIFVHDKRVPGMLHGRVVRPPYAGVDAGDFVGNTLQSVDESSIAHIPGIRAVVVIRDFIGIVAEREEHADAAMRELKVVWKPWPGMPPLGDLQQALRDNPATRRVLVDRGDVAGGIADAAQPMQRNYVWPYQLHASIGPSCALADWRGDALTVWAGTQNPHVLRADLSTLTGLPDTAIDVVRMEAAGCYGRNCADDVAADAALLSRAVGAPVRVQLSREQEHLWEPKGAAQLMQVDGGLTADGEVAAYDFQTSYPSNGAPTLALLLTGIVEAASTAYEMGDRTAVPPYDYANLRVVANDMPPILRASWLRGVSALPNSFAHESYVDELATAAGVDPVAFRLRHLKDDRAVDLINATAARAGWSAHDAPQQQASEGPWLKGQGFAYARYVHSRFPGFGAAWAAWVADVEVHRDTGEVNVRRVVVGHDAGLMVNPAGVQHQIHGNVLQTTSRALKESLPVDSKTNVPVAREWGGYPILNFREVPVIDVMMMPRPGEPPLGAGESSSVPGTAAIANAIFDATGVRFREPPFTPELIRAAMNGGSVPAPREGRAESSRDGTEVAFGPSPQPCPRGRGSRLGRFATWFRELRSSPSPLRGEGRGEGPRDGTEGDRGSSPEPSYRSGGNRLPSDSQLPRSRRIGARTLALTTALAGVGLAAFGWRPVIAPIAGGSANVYTAATIDRGRQLAAAGDCIVCHTAPNAIPNAGGRAMETPFGTVYSTNLTPDVETGIGAWSFSAFQRAMREGISRDGTHLYPAFPYTAFTKTTDDDLTALYAYLMTQPPVRSTAPTTRLAFPFNVRPLMSLWNALYLTPGPVTVAPGRSAEWTRGAYLVEGLGHCGACHSARNAFGAERVGAGHLAGATVDGWEAPPLTALSRAPVPWTETELFNYLRHGHSVDHGNAGGPMAPVVQQLQQLPEADIRAMARYLASFNQPAASPELPATLVASSTAKVDALHGPAQRLFVNACGACHHAGDGPQLLGQNLPFALNTNLHSDKPDNLLRTVLEGIREPATREIGFMPSFRDALDDSQIAQIAGYMRQRFAPDKPAWADLPAAVARIRGSAG